MELFAQASRQNHMIATSKGIISFIDLWKMKSSTLLELEDSLTAKTQVKAGTSRRNIEKTKERLHDELSLSLVTFVLDVFEAEAVNSSIRAAKKADIELLQAAIQEDEKATLKNLSIDEKKAKLAELLKG